MKKPRTMHRPISNQSRMHIFVYTLKKHAQVGKLNELGLSTPQTYVRVPNRPTGLKTILKLLCYKA